TKRGKTGKASFDFTTRQGTNWMANPEGRAGLLYGKDAAGNLISFNLYQHELEMGHGPIFTNGRNEGYQMSTSGGSEANRYYLSGSYADDVGIVWWNWDKKFTGRANIDVQANDKLRLQASVSHVRDRTRLAQQAINIDPFSNLVWGSIGTVDKANRGFGF